MTRTANIIRSLSVIALMVLFLLPMAGHLLTADKDVSTVENRTLQTRPAWTGNWTSYRKSFDIYLNDQFGFRGLGIKADNQLKLVFEGELPLVVLGQQDWLFLSEPALWNSYQGKTFTPETVDSWLESLRNLKAAFEENGAQFYAMIPPNKARIYPEHAPIHYGAPGPHLLAALFADSRADDLNLINVMPPLLSQKETAQVYYRTDTHWTSIGAYQAYAAFIETVNAKGGNVRLLGQDKLKPKRVQDREGDLFRLFAKSDFETDTLLDFTPPAAAGFGPRKFDKKSAAPEGLKPKIFEKKAPETTLVIIGDSFSDRLIPLLKHSFDKIVIVHHQEGAFTVDDVLKYDPDFVLFAPVERFGEKLTIFPADIAPN